MNINTTLNISDKNDNLLKQKAMLLNLSVNDLIIKLLSSYLNNQKGRYKVFSRVTYQKKIGNQLWKTIHVSFSPGFYDTCLDLRKFHKFSLSNILSQAINLYLEDIILNVSDNNACSYIFLASDMLDCSFFIITWNKPADKILKKLYEIYKKYKN